MIRPFQPSTGLTNRNGKIIFSAHFAERFGDCLNPEDKPVVTGDVNDGTALKSLLDQMEEKGWIVDESTDKKASAPEIKKRKSRREILRNLGGFFFKGKQ